MVRSGLGFGAARPDVASVAAAKAAAAARQAQEKREAEMKPGLNRTNAPPSKPTAGASGGAQAPARRAVQGPSMPPPPKPAGSSAARAAKPSAREAEDDGYEWKPPTEQSEGKQAALLKKLGY